MIRSLGFILKIILLIFLLLLSTYLDSSKRIQTENVSICIAYCVSSDHLSYHSHHPVVVEEFIYLKSYLLHPFWCHDTTTPLKRDIWNLLSNVVYFCVCSHIKLQFNKYDNFVVQLPLNSLFKEFMKKICSRIETLLSKALMIKTQKLSWFNCSSSTIGGHFFFGLAAFAPLLIPRLLFFP